MPVTNLSRAFYQQLKTKLPFFDMEMVFGFLIASCRVVSYFLVKEEFLQPKKLFSIYPQFFPAVNEVILMNINK